MKGAAAYAGMVMAEFAQVGLMIASKAAILSGMPNLVFILYSNTLASLILLPSCLLFHRFSLSLSLLFFLSLPIPLGIPIINDNNSSNFWQITASSTHLLTSQRILLACPTWVVLNPIYFKLATEIVYWGCFG